MTNGRRTAWRIGGGALQRALIFVAVAIAGGTVCAGQKAEKQAEQEVKGTGYKEFPETMFDCVQQPSSGAVAKASVSPQPAHDPLSGTYDLCVDIRTLRSNTTEMYWKQTDSLRIVVFNNPFLYQYTVDVGETTIADDDVLGKLGAIGLSVSSQETGAKPAAPAITTTAIVVHPPACADFAINDTTDAAAGKLQCKASWLVDELGKKEAAYEDFRVDVVKRLASLRSEKADLSRLWTDTSSLRIDALQKYQELAGGSFEPQLVQAARVTKVYHARESDRLARAKQDEATARAVAKVLGEKKGQTAKEPSDQQAKIDQLVTEGKDVQDKVDVLEAIAAQLAHTACVYQARKTGEFAALSSQVYEPLSKILGNADNNPFRKEIRLGPYADPTSALVTFTRNVVTDGLATGAASKDSSEFTCTSDPKALLNNASLAATADDLLPKNAIMRGSSAKSGNASAPGKSAKPSDTEKDATTVRMKQPLVFGGARLIVSGGLTTGVLHKQEFQRTLTLAGPTVVGLKTDSAVRFTPMLFAHTRLWAPRHSPDAYYFTFGVTSNSDNKGTSPEFMIGGSRSLAQQKFFLSAGVYIGQQQKLDGGIHVGDVIPPSFTGDLPVTKSYHAGVAFSLSYRFASTKDPKDNAPAQAAKPGSGK